MSIFDRSYSLLRLAGIGMLLGIALSCTSPTIVSSIVDKHNENSVDEIRKTSRGPTFSGSYGAPANGDILQYSDFVIKAQVNSISHTRWNQDSGEYWEETIVDDIGETTVVALPYYEIDFSVEDILLDEIEEVEEQITITVIGNSPLDYGESLGLEVGDTIISVHGKGEMAWRTKPVTYNQDGGFMETGKKPTYRFIGYPNDAYLLQGADGLYSGTVFKNELGPLSLKTIKELIRR